MFSTDDIVGPYELIRPLGSGAFGEVWLVRHKDLDDERAMKIPTDPDYVRQLRQEGQIQHKLQHPNIVETIDLNTMHDPPYFVMEYVEGQDLRKRLKTDEKLRVGEALDIIRQILEAMEHAHARGVLHRDLKPENILIAADSHVKITDFGLGQVQAQVAQSLLLSGSMMSSQGVSVSGTFQYMSPEQQSGEDADLRDDVYSVGIIGCELLTGRRPTAMGLSAAFERSGIDQSIAQVIGKALDDRNHRYASAKDMRSAVTSLICDLLAERQQQCRDEEQLRAEHRHVQLGSQYRVTQKPDDELEGLHRDREHQQEPRRKEYSQEAASAPAERSRSKKAQVIGALIGVLIGLLGSDAYVKGHASSYELPVVLMWGSCFGAFGGGDRLVSHGTLEENTDVAVQESPSHWCTCRITPWLLPGRRRRSSSV